MPNPFFSFKEFTVYHDRCAMKVGTDGVLLGAWTDISASRNVLDIGTGTGLIALMIAQRSKACITAIDIDEDAVLQAFDNVLSSTWKSRIKVMMQDIRTYQPLQLFDTIVSNPPYFINSLKCPDGKRNTARHTDTLSADILLQKAADLLTPDGKFSLIIPSEQSKCVIQMADDAGLYLSRHTKVITRPGLPPKRSLMEFCKERGSIQESELTVELQRHVYTEEYIALTKDFYLKM